MRGRVTWSSQRCWKQCPFCRALEALIRTAVFFLGRMGNHWRFMSRGVTWCNLCDIMKEEIMKFADGLTMVAAAKLLQLCLTLCDPIDDRPPGSPVPGILQARTLEWVAISFSNARKWKVKVKSLSHVWLLVTPWTAAYQAPLSMGFSRQEYWSGVPLPFPWLW